jgi:hypothetical protein
MRQAWGEAAGGAPSIAEAAALWLLVAAAAVALAWGIWRLFSMA